MNEKSHHEQIRKGMRRGNALFLGLITLLCITAMYSWIAFKWYYGRKGDVA